MKLFDRFKTKKQSSIHPIWDLALPSNPLNSKSNLQNDLASGLTSNIFTGLNDIMPNPDPILKTMRWNADIDAYSDLLSDPQLYGVIENNRKPGVTSLLMDLNGNSNADPKEVEFLTKFFDRLIDDGIYDNCVNQSLDTPQYGRMVFGNIWNTVDNYFIPTFISVIPHYYNKFNYGGDLLVSTDGISYNPPVHPAKYIALRHKPTAFNPYGEALLSKCYWNIRFKKDGMKLWAMFMEKYGMPVVAGTYNAATLGASFGVSPQTAADMLFEKLSVMAKDNVIVMPNGVDLKIEKTGAGGDIPIFENLVRICDEQNTKLQLGHSGASESTSGDKLSNDTTATEVRQHIVHSDKKYPVALFNQIIYWIHQFNFSGPEIPRFNLYKEEDVDLAYAQRDATLAPIMTLSGIKPSKSYFIKTYGFTEDDLIETPSGSLLPASSPAPQTSKSNLIAMNYDANKLVKEIKNYKYLNAADGNPDQKLIDISADDQQSDTSLTDIMINAVMKYLNNKDDAESAISDLAKLLPDMNDAKFQSELEKILFAADMVGRFSVLDELKGR